METLREDFSVGAWLVRPSLNRIVHQEDEIQVEPRIMHVLLCLAEQQGDVVSREALLEAVWPGVVVTEDPLNRAISELRKYFSDDPKNPQYIETIRKVGYRLIAPVNTPPEHLPPPVTNDEAANSIPTERPAAPLSASFPAWFVTAMIALIAVPFLVIGQSWMDTPEAPVASRPTPFTSMPGLEFDPTFSPDGSRIAFIWDGETGDNFDIYVRLLNASSMVRLTTSPARDEHPAWSPDGQFIAYVQMSESGCMIMQVPALGGLPRHLADCTQARDLVWSPDGSTLLYTDHATPEEPFRIYTLKLDASQSYPLTTPPPSYFGDSSPAYSPDGATFAFVRSSITGLHHIHTMPIDGETSTAISTENQHIESLSWPSADMLVYASNWNGPISLYARSIRSRTSNWILTGGDAVRHPTLNANGDLVYEEWRWDKNIWRYYPDSSTVPAAPFLASTRWDRSPSISPDGKKVAFISNRTGTYEIWMWDQETNRLEAITDFAGPNLNMPRWSPDGTAITFDLRSNGNADVYTLDIATGRLLQITDHEANDITPFWGLDGRSIYHSSDRSGAWEIWKTDVQNRASTQVTTSGGYSVQTAPGSEWIYFTKYRIPGIWRIPAGGGAEELVTDALRSGDWGNWQVLEGGIYFVDRNAPIHTSLATARPGTAIAFFDFDTEEIRHLHTPEKPVANPGMAVSSDGQQVMYVQIDNTESDLMRTAIP